jgi:tetratricopeptide (TPR) repeat protein
MKSNYLVLVLMMGLSGAVLSGCASKLKHPAQASASASMAGQSNQDANTVAAEDLWPNDFVDEEPHPAGKGNPEALARFATGMTYEWNDQDEKAVEQFYASALADPSNEHLAIKVAERFLKSKQTPKAVKVLATSARRPDASGRLLSWLARAELADGKTNEALAASRLSIRRDPTAFDGYESQIEIFLQGHQGAKAVRAMDQAARSINPDPEALIDLAGDYITYLKFHQKDLITKANAMALLDRISGINFASPRLWQALADDYSQLNQPKKAAAIYVRILAETPDSSASHEATPGHRSR